MERLQKYMARSGVASRRQCEKMIAAGMVKVNGKTVTEPGTCVEPGVDRVEVSGRILAGPEQKVYLLLYKPRGYLSTVKDPRGRRKVTDLISGVAQRVYPVGRLDYDSEGLILLTNDGELAHALTHPRHEIPKTYLARVTGTPKQESLERMARGLLLEDGPTAPAAVRLVEVDARGNALLEITIHEGRNRQIRRMCACIGHPVLRLQRVRIGPLTPEGLKPGQFRLLSREEVSRLQDLIR